MKTLSTFAFAGLLLLLAGPASATNCTQKRALEFFSYDTAGILWQNQRQDSPLDSGKQRIMVHVLFQDGVEPYDYAGAIAECTGIENKLVGQVRNLSFDFLNTSSQPVHIGGGSPRYSVEIDSDNDGVADTVAFMAAVHCDAPLVEDPEWSRADFTGRVTAGCSIFVGAEQFTSDGSSSAWSLMATAHPTWKVKQAYLLVDEDGTTFVDRLAFHNRMFTGPGTGSAGIKNCGSEAVC